MSCQIPLHVWTLRACARKILHSGDPRTHAPNDASGTQEPSYTRSEKQLLLSLDGALEDFSFQIDAHTVFAPGWDDNFLAHWADTATNIPYGRISTRASDFRWERPKGLSMRSASAGPGLRAQASCANDVQSCVDVGPPNVDKVLGGQA